MGGRVFQQQVAFAVEIFRAVLWQSAEAIPTEVFDQILQQPRLGGALFKVVSDRALAIRSWVFCKPCAVDRSLNPEQVVASTGFVSHGALDDSVVRTMPRGYGTEARLIFIPLPVPGKWTPEGLELWVDQQGLVIADPYSLAAAIKNDPGFVDAHPTATQWFDEDSRPCFMSYRRRTIRGVGAERCVQVSRRTHDWGGVWWIACLPKPAE
jgi:hypothetical protein